VHLTIAMLTYRRNDYLAQVIPELLAQADDVCDAQTTVSVLIVDNDPQAGARAVVEAARAALAGGGGLLHALGGSPEHHHHPLVNGRLVLTRALRLVNFLVD